MISVTASPFVDDTDLPWTYEEDGFIHWVDEVFFEGYKAGPDAPFPSLREAVVHLREMGYEVQIS